MPSTRTPQPPAPVSDTPHGGRVNTAIIGSGNIGTDLMIKLIRARGPLNLVAMAGIDPASDGLARARSLGVRTTHRGLDGLLGMDVFDDIDIVLDATSAGAHVRHASVLAEHNKYVVDLTPAAVGPYVVPAVNLDEVLSAKAVNVNMVTCGGQATIPIVHAIARVTDVAYAEIVASIASKSAGPGTRANIDEFTETTSAAIEQVGGAARGKAIIILNPAEPPLMMRDTVSCLVGDPDEAAIRDSIVRVVEEVSTYVPGYRMKHDVQFSRVDEGSVASLLPPGSPPVTTRITVFLEVEGAAHYLPAYAGNLDIMTSAALRTAEHIAGRLLDRVQVGVR